MRKTLNEKKYTRNKYSARTRIHELHNLIRDPVFCIGQAVRPASIIPITSVLKTVWRFNTIRFNNVSGLFLHSNDTPFKDSLLHHFMVLDKRMAMGRSVGKTKPGGDGRQGDNDDSNEWEYMLPTNSR